MEELVNLFHGFAVALQPFNILLMFVGIISIAIIGYLLNEIILFFERRLFAYREEIN